MPANAHRISIRLPYVLGDTVQVYELPDGGSHDEPVAAGDYSTETALELAPPKTAAKLADLGRYIVVGFKHIVPEGLDHILFVLGLFLLSNRLVPLLWQVSAFTVAHSITLGLSIYGVIRLPPSITEPLIAASIVCIAVENLFTSKLQPWRPLVVFCFGLIHGLGFASAFAEVGLPQNHFLIGLFGFNVGVECGQLAVISGAFLVVGWFRDRPWYRRVVVIPASALIAAPRRCSGPCSVSSGCGEREVIAVPLTSVELNAGAARQPGPRPTICSAEAQHQFQCPTRRDLGIILASNDPTADRSASPTGCTDFPANCFSP